MTYSQDIEALHERFDSEYRREAETLRERVRDLGAALKLAEENRIAAIAHLRCALVQSLPSDDQIIIEHIRSAVTELERGGKGKNG